MVFSWIVGPTRPVTRKMKLFDSISYDDKYVLEAFQDFTICQKR